MSSTMGTTGTAPVQGQTQQGINTPTAAATPLPINNTTTPSVQTVDPITGQSPGSNQGTGLTFDQVENYWIQAGGNPQAASMAAAVADAESGLNAGAKRTNPDGTIGVGLWLLPQNGSPPGSTDPLANARAAVQFSQNGTDWSQWCSAWSDNNCGENNGTYLGSGANALMSLQTQASSPSYSMFGTAPASSGVGASSAASSVAGGSVSSNPRAKFILLGVIILIAVGIFFYTQKSKQQEQPPETEQQQ